MGDTTSVDRLSGGEVETIRLYLDLEPGTNADLEVVARASLEFANTLRELAFVMDPSLAFRVELVSGTEGSLSLKAFIRAFGIKDRLGKLTVGALAGTMLTYFVAHTRDWTFEKVMDHVFTSEEKAQIAPADLEHAARIIADAVERGIAATQAERVYRELQTDPAVKGVAVARSAEGRPAGIVPRSEFEARAGLLRQEVESGTKRTRDEIVTLRLISPVLEESRRHWRFRGASGDFGAAMKDAKFLDDLLNGKTAVPMVSNVLLEVEMHTAEERKNGVWHVKDRSIVRVRQVRPPGVQASLDLPVSPR